MHTSTHSSSRRLLKRLQAMYIGSSPAEQVATTASFLPSISKQVTPTIKDYVGESPSIIYGSQSICIHSNPATCCSLLRMQPANHGVSMYTCRLTSISLLRCVLHLQPRACSLEPRACSLEPRACSLEPRACSLEPRACSLEPRACSLEPRACSLEPRACSLEPRACSLEPAA